MSEHRDAVVLLRNTLRCTRKRPPDVRRLGGGRPQLLPLLLFHPRRASTIRACASSSRSLSSPSPPADRAPDPAVARRTRAPPSPTSFARRQRRAPPAATPVSC